MRFMSWVLVVAVCAAVGAPARSASDPFDRALAAWDAGDYVPALEGFIGVLQGPGSSHHLERIALLTGELFHVTPVAPDGRALRFSASGRYAAFDTGGQTDPVTHIVDLDAGLREVATLNGLSASFCPTRDAVTYLRTTSTPEGNEIRASVERLIASENPDRVTLTAQVQRLTQLDARESDLVVRDLGSGRETTLATGGLLKMMPRFSADGREVYFIGAPEGETTRNDIYATSETAPARSLTSAGAAAGVAPATGFKTGHLVVPGGRYLVYQVAAQSPFAGGAAGGGGRGRGAGGAAAARQMAVLDLADGRDTILTGYSYAVAAGGSALAYLDRAGTDTLVRVIRFGGPIEPVTIKKSAETIGAPALSPDGARVAYSALHTRNQEIFVAASDGSGETRVTREIQHDGRPLFLSNSRLVAIKGEARHSRSHLYDLDEGTGIRLVHNNTLRTISPEYEWAAHPDGTRLLVVADRDGDTISPERGVFLVDLTRKIGLSDLLARLRSNLEAERRLREEGAATFESIEATVREAVSRVSMARLYDYQEALFAFDSKYVGQPGNERAGRYLFETLKSFGYEPEYQWFSARGAKTANVLATLRGTENPELVYVLSSHYDSNLRSPGGDDNNSGVAVLLETARVLAGQPLPSTVIFAAFTGEEAGLLGSREFVRQAVEKKVPFLGALNNDMIGWANDYHLDNTIRYSNAGIRDLQHAASFLFSRLVTYDSRYFRSTDAAAYYEAYGDIVGGFGSYPVLGNPYYHQPTDLLETVNQQLMFEMTRATVASVMGLASSPARVKGLKATPGRGGIDLAWAASPEKGVTGYTVSWGSAATPFARTRFVTVPAATLTAAAIGNARPVHVAVRAVTARGMRGWDWARAVVEE